MTEHNDSIPSRVNDGDPPLSVESNATAPTEDYTLVYSSEEPYEAQSSSGWNPDDSTVTDESGWLLDIKQPAPLDDTSLQPSWPWKQGVMRDGRFRGGGRHVRMEMRVDREGAGVISGDLFDAAQRWHASFRTRVGEDLETTPNGPWTVVVRDRDGLHGLGKIAMRKAGDRDGGVAVLRFERRLGDLPANRDILIALDYQGRALRSLGLELEGEQGIELPPRIEYRGRIVGMSEIFADAGIEISDTGVGTSIRPPPEPWGQAQIHALLSDLDELMRSTAQSDLSAPAWELRLLWLSRSKRPGLLGVMFDIMDDLPRQGSAVFSKEIEDLARTDVKVKQLQTVAHEIGHALNLAHRFEPAVGHLGSTSIMNYDWRYRGGGFADEYWRLFDFTFDRDELAFLRHGPRDAVIPGGQGFHSESYWLGASEEFGPHEIDRSVSLEINPPRAGNDGNEREFRFCQIPLFELRLVNRSQRTLRVPRRLLDVKAGFLEVEYQRLGVSNEPTLFRPCINRCVDIGAGLVRDIAPGENISDNLNLIFGAKGFTLADPGRYSVRVSTVFSMRDSSGEPTSVRVRSAPCLCRVAPPDSRQEEKDAQLLLDPRAGAFLVLGGSRARHLRETGGRLVELAQRRVAENATDPVAAGLLRCAAIDECRTYWRAFRRREEITYRRENPDMDAAASFGAELAKMPLERYFDAETYGSTRGLIQWIAQTTKAK